MKRLSYIQRSTENHWVGDGFPVRSVFSYNDHDAAIGLSPFLLLDYAGPATFPATDKKLGVGEHPHRGFETVTIVYDGEVAHRDSAGGGGLIRPGDVQWMTAGGGLVHEEFHGDDYAKRGGPFEMVQLWVNLPKKHKMTPPKYQGITKAQIPQIDLPEEAGFVRVIAGEYENNKGPAQTFTPMNVWDVRVKAGKQVAFTLPEGHTTSVFVLKGRIESSEKKPISAAELALFDPNGDTLSFEALEDATLLLLSGEPLNEPIVGYGPFVMNTKQEITQAIVDYQSGRLGTLS